MLNASSDALLNESKHSIPWNEGIDPVAGRDFTSSKLLVCEFFMQFDGISPKEKEVPAHDVDMRTANPPEDEAVMDIVHQLTSGVFLMDEANWEFDGSKSAGMPENRPAALNEND